MSKTSQNNLPSVAFISPRATSLFYPEIVYAHGGAELQIACLARELARRGMKVTLITADCGQPRDAVRDGLRLLSIPHRPGPGAKLAMQIALLRAGADCYVQRGRGSMTKETAVFCAMRRRPFVYWVANDMDCSAKLGEQYNDARRNRWFLWGLHRADRIVAQHEGQREMLRENEGLDSTVIYNGLPTCEWDDSAPREGHLWIAKCTTLKDPMALLDLAARYPRERFTMISPRDMGEASLDAEADAALRELPNVERLDRIPNEMIGGYYRRAKTLILTSRVEGFPNTILEAFRAGAAVVSLRIDPGAIMQRNDIGRCAGGDFERFACDFGELIERGDLRDGLRRRAFDFTQRELTIARVADRFIEVLKSLGRP